MTNENEETKIASDEYNEEDMIKEFGDIDPMEDQEDEIMEFQDEDSEVDIDAEGTELASFESAEIEEKEFIEDDKIVSIIESILFATDKPVKMSLIKQAFQGSDVKKQKIEKAIEKLMIDYADPRRGVAIEEVQGGYQVRTKVDNMDYLKLLKKARPFKLSGPALEVLSIVAYKQPLVKSEVDQIRGVESGHLMRALMDKRLIRFDGKSELPGKPMLYGTTKYFLEVFGLRSIKELPSLSEIDQLIPEGIGEKEEEKEDLSQVSDTMGSEQGVSYSESEEELGKIADKLSEIDTTTEFFEEEKRKEKDRKEAQKARDIREAIDFEEEVSGKDRKWLERYEAKLAEREAEKEVEKKQQESEEENQLATDVANESAPEPLTDPADSSAKLAEVEVEAKPENDLYSELESLKENASVNEGTKELEGLNFVEEEDLGTFDFDKENEKETEV